MGRLARKPAESLIVAAWLLLPIMLTAYGDGNRGSVAGSPVTASSTAASSASRTINDSSVDSDVKNGTNTTTTDGYDNVNATSATGNGTEYVVRKGNYTCIKKRARAFTKKITQRTTFKINMRKAAYNFAGRVVRGIGAIGSANLIRGAAALFQRINHPWKDRLLGTNPTTRAPMFCTHHDCRAQRGFHHAGLSANRKKISIWEMTGGQPLQIEKDKKSEKTGPEPDLNIERSLMDASKFGTKNGFSPEKDYRKGDRSHIESESGLKLDEAIARLDIPASTAQLLASESAVALDPTIPIHEQPIPESMIGPYIAPHRVGISSDLQPWRGETVDRPYEMKGKQEFGSPEDRGVKSIVHYFNPLLYRHQGAVHKNCHTPHSPLQTTRKPADFGNFMNRRNAAYRINNRWKGLRDLSNKLLEESKLSLKSENFYHKKLYLNRIVDFLSSKRSPITPLLSNSKSLYQSLAESIVDFALGKKSDLLDLPIPSIPQKSNLLLA